MRPRENGVSLIELMTVVVILGILASVAIPSYRAYLLRANRSDAKSALMQLQVAQEKYYLQKNEYTDKVTDAPPTGLGLAETTTNGYYKISVPTLAADKQSYTAQAVAVTGAGQTDDTKCGSFTITDTGTKAVSGSLGAAVCWK